MKRLFVLLIALLLVTSLVAGTKDHQSNGKPFQELWEAIEGAFDSAYQELHDAIDNLVAGLAALTSRVETLEAEGCACDISRQEFDALEARVAVLEASGPCLCPDVWDPVCGIDGLTYKNACEAGCAGVMVAHVGECDGAAACTLTEIEGLQSCLGGCGIDQSCFFGCLDALSEGCSGAVMDLLSCSFGTCAFGSDLSEYFGCAQEACPAEYIAVFGTEPIEGLPCDDGDACTVGTVWAGGVCTGGSPLDCDDSNACMSFACDPSVGCVYTADRLGWACDDGDPCTYDDLCTDSGECVGTYDNACDPVDADGDGYFAGEDDCDDADPAVYPGAIEICDGLDNDCDGAADNDLTPPPCSKVGVGVCGAGVKTCLGSLGWRDCTDDEYGLENPSYEPIEVTCDGQDNDCDGEPDEGLLNTCGGCAVLPAEPGDPCGYGGTGVFECFDKDQLVCVGEAECLSDADCWEGVQPSVCIDQAACQGLRTEPWCDAGLCSTRQVDDDSGCAEVVSDECGPYLPVYCSGDPDQTAPVCPSHCLDNIDCDQGAFCVTGLCVA